MQSDTSKCFDWFNGKPEQRILAWRHYRQTLTSNHLQRVAEIWANCPLVNNYLEPDFPENWPDPWALISSGLYCNLARALGMFYTLYYSDYQHKQELRIVCYKDIGNHQYLNLVVSGPEKYMLNYNLGQVVNTCAVPPKAQLINSLTYQNIQEKREGKS